jgi:hypothetical protein
MEMQADLNFWFAKVSLKMKAVRQHFAWWFALL